MGGPLRSSSGMAEGVRTTLRRNAASHVDLAHSGSSAVAAMLADAADDPDKARQTCCTPCLHLQQLQPDIARSK